MKIEDIPNSEQVQQSIEKLKNYDWPKYNSAVDLNDYIKSITTPLASEFQGMLDYVQVINSKEFGFNVFRAREVSTFGNIELICEHSYKPINLTKDMGRCHFPHHPVFYGSTNALVALSEVIRDTDFSGKTYCISKWEITSSEIPFVFQPLLFSDLHEDNPYNILKNSLKEKINKPFEGKLTDSQVEGVSLYLEFLGNLFTYDKDYHISASFAHRRLYDTLPKYRTEMIMYPSAQSLYKGVNLAIHPNFVDNRMVLKRLYFVKVNTLDKEVGKMTFQMNKYGEILRSAILLKGMDPDDKDLKDGLEKDFDFKGEMELSENVN